MKLILTTPFLETCGGLERVMLKIAQRFDPTIHCLRYNPDNTFEEFRKLDIRTPKTNSASKILERLPFGNRAAGAIAAGNYFYNLKLDPREYDVINAHQTPSEWIRNRNPRVIWYCHTPNREAFDLYEWRMKQRSLPSKAVFWTSIQAFRKLEFQTVPKIECIFTNSRNSQGRIKKYLHRESEVLYPGVEVRRFSNRAHEHYFFRPDRIVPEKEIEYAIEAFKKFKKTSIGAKHDTQDWKLVIAGALSQRPEHQAYHKKLLALIDGDKSISIETNVTEERMLDLYARCSAVLHTPVNEDFGLIPLEAMASSKPCIARNEGGPRETIIDGTDGFLINTPEEMAERMTLLAQDPELTARMGKAGRKKVEQHFTWDVFLKRFEEIAKEVAIDDNKRANR